MAEPMDLDDLFGGRLDCRHRNVGLGLWFMADGSEHVIKWCFDCQAPPFGLRAVPKAGVNLTGLPTVVDNRAAGELCAVEGCGSRATQLHHWAPQSLEEWFGDEWSKWPTSWLCRDKHHPLWHQVVTPDLTGPKRIGEVMQDARRGTTLRELLDAARTMVARKKGEAAD